MAMQRSPGPWVVEEMVRTSFPISAAVTGVTMLMWEAEESLKVRNSTRFWLKLVGCLNESQYICMDATIYLNHKQTITYLVVQPVIMMDPGLICLAWAG